MTSDHIYQVAKVGCTPRIVSAQAIDDLTLILQFTNNELRKYNISKLLDKPMFSPLKNSAFFRNFIIESGGYGSVWNEEVDISQYELWQNGVSTTNYDDKNKRSKGCLRGSNIKRDRMGCILKPKESPSD